MQKSYHSYYILSLLFLASCSFDQLPGRKTLRDCPKPSAVIQFVADPSNPLRYTIKLDQVNGEAETVVWTIGNETKTLKPGESQTINFIQPGTYPIKAVLQNVCNNNTTIEQSLSISLSRPSVATGRTETVSPTSATVLMVFSSAGNSALTQLGIVYGEEANTSPSLTNGGVFVAALTSSKAGDSLRVVLPGLATGRKYNYVAYAKNGAGETYGTPARQFTTSTPTFSIDTWARILGGAGADFGYTLLTLPDTGYLIAGNSSSNDGDIGGNRGSYDAWVARLDNNGTVLWKKNLGGSGDDVLWSAQLAADGNYLLIGNTSSTNGDITSNAGGYDPWVVKLSTSGNVLYSRTYGTVNDDYGYTLSINGGSYAISTETRLPSGSLVGSIRLINESTGAVQNTFSINDARYFGLAAVPSGGFIAIGNAGPNAGVFTNGQSDMLITRLTSGLGLNGAHQAKGSTADDGGNHIIPITDGYLVVGATKVGANPATAASDFFVVKLDLAGTEIWKFNYGGTGDDLANGAIQTSDGGYLIVGSTTSNNGQITTNKGGTDVWVIKLNTNGQMQWQRTCGGSGNDYGYKIAATKDGGFLIVGSTTSNNGDIPGNKGGNDLLLLKIDGSGKL